MQKTGGTNDIREPYKSASGIWSSHEKHSKPLGVGLRDGDMIRCAVWKVTQGKW